MCFNEKVSLITYLAGLSGSAALLTKNKIPEALFYGWVSQMQLVDYFLWKNQPCEITSTNKICKKDELVNCNKTNNYITGAGIIINHLEPFILFMGIVLYSKKTLPLGIIIFFIIFMVLISLYTIHIFAKDNDDNLCTTVSETSDPHLHWKWNNESYHGIIYILFLIIIIVLSYFGLEKGYINAIIAFIAYIASYIIYKDKKSVGAMWCFGAAFVPWLLYAIY